MKTNLKQNRTCFAEGFLLSLVCLALSGCSNDMSDLEQKIAEVKARPKDKIDPIPPIKTTEPFAFDLDGSRDPFATVEKEEPPETEVETGSLIKPDPTRVKEDLESYALDSLKMVGTLLKDSTLWGLVKSSNGTVYRVKVGNYMGLNDGKIIEVSGDEIKLTEIVPDKSADKNKMRFNVQDASLKLEAK